MAYGVNSKTDTEHSIPTNTPLPSSRRNASAIWSVQIHQADGPTTAICCTTWKPACSEQWGSHDASHQIQRTVDTSACATPLHGDCDRSVLQPGRTSQRTNGSPAKRTSN